MGLGLRDDLVAFRIRQQPLHAERQVNGMIVKDLNELCVVCVPEKPSARAGSAA